MEDKLGADDDEPDSCIRRSGFKDGVANEIGDKPTLRSKELRL